MTKIKRKQLALNITNAPDGEYGLPGGNIPNVLEGDVLEEALDKIIETLDKMSPFPPPKLNDLTLTLSESIAGPVTANLASTGISTSNIFKYTDNAKLTYTTTGNPLNVQNRDGHFYFDATPNARVRFKHEYNTSTKTVDINYLDTLTNPPQDNINLITDSTDGFDITTNILEFRDFYADDPVYAASSSDFFNSIKSINTVQINVNNTADNLERNVYLEYSSKGDFSDTITINNAPYKYRIEKSDAPTVVGTPNFSYISPMSGHISGVATLQAGDTIRVSATLSNVVKYYYPNIAAITTVIATNSVNYQLSGTFSENTNIQIENNHTVLTNRYSESISGTVRPYDIFAGGSTVNVQTLTNFRVDTKGMARALADISKRLVSPVDPVNSSTPWTTPISSANAYYDMIAHNQSLDVSTGAYRQALQVIEGRYEYPRAVNYSQYVDNNGIASPNYTNTNGNFPSSDWRYIDINIGTINNITSLKLVFGGATWTTKQPSGLIILLRVEGTQPTGGDGWLNCMAAYAGTGDPTGTDDPVPPATARDAYVINSPESTDDGRTRYITFGTAPKIGDVIVRVGIQNGSGNVFETITIQ